MTQQTRDPLGLSERHLIIYNRLVEAADNHESCPTNPDLAALAGYANNGSVATVIRRLQERGLILVEYIANSRSVTIVATGKSTTPTQKNSFDLALKHEKEVYDFLKLKAEKGEECPSNSEIAVVLDCLSIGTPPNVMNRLEKKGLIKVDRYMRSRRVTIVMTGEQTAEPSHKSIHWRRRKNYSPKQLKNNLADAIANGSELYDAAKLLNISKSYARILWGDIRREMGMVVA